VLVVHSVVTQAAPARAPLPFDPTCEACRQIRKNPSGAARVAHTCGRSLEARDARAQAERAARLASTSPATQSDGEEGGE